MGKEKFDNWPKIDAPNDETVVLPDGFAREPDPSQYIVNQQETTRVAPRQSIEPDSVTIDRLLNNNLAPKIDDPNQLGKKYAVDGTQSIRPLPTSSYVEDARLPESFLKPAPVRARKEPEAKTSLIKRLFGF